MILDSDPWSEILAQVLREEGLCSSNEEAAAIVETVSAEQQEEGCFANESSRLNTALQEYLGISQEESDLVILRCKVLLGEDESEEELTGSNNMDQEGAIQEDDEIVQEEDEDDDGDTIGEGDCELCERTILLTRHHLIPKSTWSKLEPRLLHAAVARDKGDLHKATMIVGDGLLHLLDSIESSDKASIRAALARTCNICRPCHSAVHRAHDNMTLAQSYNTVEKLLQDEKVFKFSKWANKQRVGKYARREVR